MDQAFVDAVQKVKSNFRRRTLDETVRGVVAYYSHRSVRILCPASRIVDAVADRVPPEAPFLCEIAKAGKSAVADRACRSGAGRMPLFRGREIV